VFLDTIHDFVGAQSASTSIVILGSTLGAMLLSSDKLAFSVFEDNPDFAKIHNFHVLSKSEESTDDDLKIPPPPKHSKKNYDLARNFQMEWSAKCPRTEMVLAHDGVLHMICCLECTEMGKKPYLMGPKLFIVHT